MYRSLIKIIIYIVAFFSIRILIYGFQLKTIWKTHLIIGKKGSGKSTYAAALVKKYADSHILEFDRQNFRFTWHKLKIYSNMHVAVRGVRFISSPEKLGNFIPEPYSVLILDEVNTIPGWDNREFKSMDKNTVTYFRYNRQYKVITYMFTQTFDIDKKLRALCDTMHLCTNLFGVYTLIRKIDKRVTIKESALDADSQIVDDIKFAPWWKIGNVKLLWIPKYTKYFKSYNPPKKPYFHYVEENIPEYRFYLSKKKRMAALENNSTE